ncbi:MAG: glycosyltransferase family 4 protein [Thermoplasmata archaeon]|nr:glycosyltransferase family 4 protein [Thermoplasmata archaeon]
MLLTNPYRPDPRVLREARALKEAGHDITLVAWDRDNGPVRESMEEGVRVFRLGPVSPFRSPLRVFLGLLRFWMSTLRASRRLEFDVIHSHDFDTLPLALLLSKLRRRPLLYDAHEVYSDMIRKDAPTAAKMLRPLERQLVRCADEIITVNELLVDLLSEGRESPARLVRNSPDMSAMTVERVREVREKHGLRGFIISYLGSLEPGRSVEELASSFSPDQGIMVVIGGSGTLQKAVEGYAARNPCVRFLGRVSTDDALAITSASDLVPAVHDPSNPNYRIGTPIKVLEAMACGRPVVTSKGIDISEIVESAGCGFVIDYNRRLLVETVVRASKEPERLAEMGLRGVQYYEKHLSWNQAKAALLEAYRALESPS